MNKCFCIFCKSNSSNSRSVEHIIPESLGNKDHVLPQGIVCDKCNNYFSIKIEKKLLEKPYFSSLRFRNSIESKKGKYPIEKAILLNPLAKVELIQSKNDGTSIIIDDENIWIKFQTIKTGKLMVPHYEICDKNDKIVSRFLGKVGIEYLALVLLEAEDGINEVTYHKGLDELRNYVRYGKDDFIWPYNLRKIYNEGELFHFDDGEYEILHEMKLLYTRNKELYIVVAIMGIEYCLNMGAPSIDGYLEWLKENGNKSPLDNEFCNKINSNRLDTCA